MKVRSITNTSKEPIRIELEDGAVTLAPDCGILNVRVNESELKRVRPLTEVRLDLSEVKGLLS